MPETLTKALDAARDAEADVVKFLRDLVAIPSESGQEKQVIERIRQEMEAVGFDEIRVDGLGNIMGRIGSGPRVIAMDSHIDTVGVGDPKAWEHDPYQGKVEDGKIYGRGSSDQKAGIACLVHAGKLIKEMDLAGECTVWMVATVMEEDSDGLCWHYILNEKVLEPEVVLITEPTSLRVYRGQRGRMSAGRSRTADGPD